MAGRERNHMYLVCCNDETIHSPVSNNPKTRLSYLLWPLENVMEVEKPNSNVFTHSIDTQSIIAIFCKNILSFLGQKLTQNYLCCFLTPWNIRSHLCKHMLS